MLSAGDLRALRMVFKEDARERLDRLERALAADSPDESATREAHTLAGAAATVRYPMIAATGHRLEIALERGELETARAAAAELREEVERRLAGPLVLHAEDDPTNQALVARIVSRRPAITLLTCATGREALELAEVHHPDLILLDVNLADSLTGHDVLRGLRAKEQTVAIPVVMLSGEAHPEAIDRARADGVTEYLTKPVELARLFAILDALEGNEG